MTWERIWPTLGAKPGAWVQNQLKAFVLDRIVQRDMQDTTLVPVSAPPAGATVGVASIRITQCGKGPPATSSFTSSQTSL